ncbi:RidA family protein [Egicoccus halophilus]|uniref:Enamine deaminase RidA n=1 Tax=Egicoccus halophilus TaxID=1670830 RepID=A0A8J3ETE0_9ACTN|nr:RidA family protein [Egicoccus halophilus]GGI09375.1 enamine deaminase RidA [Egicoccus halophilus]
MSIRHLNPAGVHAQPQLITQVVAVDERTLVHLSGQVAWDEHGDPVAPGDHVAQAAQVRRNVEACLASIGATDADIVKETIYVVDHRPERLPAILGALRGSGDATPPASTYLGVAALFAPEFVIEVDLVVAVAR